MVSPDPHPPGLLAGSPWLIPALTAALVLALAASLSLGRMDLGPGRCLEYLSRWLAGDPGLAGDTGWLVLSQVRLPRVILAVLVGVALSLAGAVYQGLFRNPLVSPDILGVAGGCTLGAALGLVLPGLDFAAVRGLAFVCGLAAVGSALGLARLVAVRSVIVLVLAGIIVGAMANALLMILKYLADPYSQLPSIVFWIMGSLTRTTWQDVSLGLPLVGGGALVIHWLRFRLNLLSLGDLQAKTLGMRPLWWRLGLITLSSLMVALAVATCGQIAWVGLVMPHLARTLVGANHERMIPVAALLGGLFMLLADDAARSLSSAELPVSIITSLAGGPLFAYLLYRNRGSGWS